MCPIDKLLVFNVLVTLNSLILIGGISIDLGHYLVLDQTLPGLGYLLILLLYCFQNGYIEDIMCMEAKFLKEIEICHLML